MSCLVGFCPQKLATIDDWVTGQPVGDILVGGQRQVMGSTILVTDGLKGCVKVRARSSLAWQADTSWFTFN